MIKMFKRVSSYDNQDIDKSYSLIDIIGEAAAHDPPSSTLEQNLFQFDLNPSFCNKEQAS